MRNVLSEERRGYTRARYRGKVTLSPVFEESVDGFLVVPSARILAQGSDVSEDGIRFKLGEVTRQLKFVRIQFKIQKFHEVNVFGRLAWRNGKQLGFHYIGLDERDRGWIREYVGKAVDGRRIRLAKIFPVLFLFHLLWGIGSPSQAATGRPLLTTHRTATMERARLVGRHSPVDRLRIAISLPVRNRTDLEDRVKRVSDPKDPLYRHYLTVQEFAEMYGASPEDYGSVSSFAQAHGLKVEKEYANRLVVDVSGASSEVEKAFHVQMNDYERADGTLFFAPDQEPSVDLETPLEHLTGLSNEFLPQAKALRNTPSQGPVPHAVPHNTPHNSGGSGVSGSFFDNDFRKAYAPGVSLTGAGQTLGLVEFAVYWPSDVANYETHCSPTLNVPLTDVYCDRTYNASSTPNCTGGESEVVLDIEMAMAMAPGLSGIEVYMGGNAVDVLGRIASDNLCKEVSSSWGWTPVQPTEDSLLAEMAVQGQSYFNAAGDGSPNSPYYGEFTSDPPYGAGAGCGNDNEPYQTVVGATELVMSGGVWSSETCIGVTYFPSWSTGGILAGASADDAIPSYQQSVPMTTNYGSTTYRNVPDVSIAGDEITDYQCQYSSPNITSGTSCSAPLWAAFIALVNQQAAANGKANVGFINPALYAIGEGANYTKDFHDITVGNNGSSTQFPAVTGYDLATGWGSPNGQNLINDLSGVVEGTATYTPTLNVSPTSTPTMTATNLGGYTSTFTPTVWNPATPHIPTSTPTPTNSSTSSATSTPTVTNTITSTATYSSTIPHTATSTMTNTSTPANTLTATTTPAFTFTNTATNSRTATQTFTSSATDTLTPLNTPTPTVTSSETATTTLENTSTGTASATSTDTLVHTATAMDTATSTNTSTATYLATCTGTLTDTSTVTATNTPPLTNTSTATYSTTCTGTSTDTSTVTATHTPPSADTQTSTTTFTSTWTLGVNTSTLTSTATLTHTATETPTNTNGYLIGGTSTATSTVTETSTASPTPATDMQVVIYPDPVKGPVVQVHLPLNATGELKIDIFTTSFRCVRRVDLPQGAQGQELSLSLKDNGGTDLANGLYYLRTRTGGKTYLNKLLVLR